jgi:hypothetical protein
MAARRATAAINPSNMTRNSFVDERYRIMEGLVLQILTADAIAVANCRRGRQI